MADRAGSGIWVAIIGALASIAVAWITASTRATAEVQDAAGRVKAEIGKSSAPIGQIATGQKLCRVYARNMFSDTLVVPREWTKKQCDDLGAKVGAPVVNLGCVFPEEVVFGRDDGSAPNRNCGWAVQ